MKATSASLVMAIVPFAHGLQQGAHGAMREGEALTVELAEDVLANKQAVLPVPFEILKDRDVGYVGNHPVLDSAKTEYKQGSLNTTREWLNGLSPNIAIYTVRIAESRQPATPPPNFRMGGVGGQSIKHLNGLVNPTSDLVLLKWQRNRWAGLKPALMHWMDRKNPDKLVAIHSNGDVLYGGCSENELKAKYDQLIDASGGTQTIVVAAEVSPYPTDLGWRYSKTSWTSDRMTSMTDSLLGGQHDWVSAYADCSNITEGLCGSPPKYQYANSGIVMGPVSDLLEMLEELETYTSEENRLVSEYYLNHQDKVTLDYVGSLAFSLHNMAKANGTLPVEVQTNSDGKKKLVNKVTSKPVCFVHGGGNSFPALKGLAQELATS